jgi:predicted acylesterase/phospholipase RssA
MRRGLALAAGGPLGGVYELGALRALEEAIEGLDFNQCRVYVGVSAGAFLASHLANGFTVTEMLRGLLFGDQEENPFDPSILFLPAYREWAHRGAQIPGLLTDALLQASLSPKTQSLFKSLSRLGRALPLGIFDNGPLQANLARVFAKKGRTNDFRKLKHRLFVVATDLEAGTPVVFGSEGLDHVPISKAVQASTSLPGLYQPLKVEGRLCVDGVLLKTMHASVAMENGADLVFCVNPIVPVDVSTEDAHRILGQDSLIRGGLPAVLSQTVRTIIHSRMLAGMARYRTTFPNSELILFRPDRKDYRLFFSNIFSFRSRRQVCEIGYKSTRKDLCRRRDLLGPILEAHGMKLRNDVLDDPKRSVWDGIGGLPHSTATVTRRLARTLEDLEAVLNLAGKG